MLNVYRELVELKRRVGLLEAELDRLRREVTQKDTTIRRQRGEIVSLKEDVESLRLYAERCNDVD